MWVLCGNSEGFLGAASAGPTLKGQRFANEPSVRGPALAAHWGPLG